VENGAAIAIGVGVVVVAFLYTRSQEQKTATMIRSAQQQSASTPKTLSFADGFALVGTAAATYFGGPGAGAQAAQQLAPR
jgi:hypothetical protein